MRRRTAAAMVALAGALTLGSLLDSATAGRPRSAGILTADLHVHPFPGDGALTVAQLRREAARRGIDVIGITAHNNALALRLDRLSDESPSATIVLEGQELTAPEFHLIALGIERLIDWRLPASAAIAAIQEQGGVAIAAHPANRFGEAFEPEALRLLDGAELAHPLRMRFPDGAADLDAFFARAQRVNPTLAPIGSTDFHIAAPLGLCRTYLLTERRTAEGALEAIRAGRTVAADAEGTLRGAPEHVAAVEAFLAASPSDGTRSAWERMAALAALLALALASWPARRQ